MLFNAASSKQYDFLPYKIYKSLILIFYNLKQHYFDCSNIFQLNPYFYARTFKVFVYSIDLIFTFHDNELY